MRVFFENMLCVYARILLKYAYILKSMQAYARIFIFNFYQSNMRI